MVIISLLAAVIPVSLYLIWLRKADKYDKEPVRLYLKNFAWGSLGAVFFTLIGSALVSSFLSGFIASEAVSDLADTVFVAPVVEEFMKGVFLFSTIGKRDFDNMTDGLVYGGAIGLGFGMTENFLYFLGASSGAEWVFLVITRTLFSCVMHFISTAVFGAFLGISKFKGSSLKYTLAMTGYLLAILIHFTWNSAVVVEESVWLGPLFMIGSVYLFRALFRYSINQEYKLINRELQEESALGYFPAFLLPVVLLEKPASYFSLDAETAKGLKQNGVKLAFRKEQIKFSQGKAAEQQLAEIGDLRKWFLETFPPEESSGLKEEKSAL
ncbi:MAG: PrsW family intramembrane metalloprotease [Ignavibacteriaceae bacterium]|nr:PrsW family intramembrane metalloprotease [Ignavibacteriaceae bacterium]